MPKIDRMLLNTVFYVVGPAILFIGAAVNLTVVIAIGLGTMLAAGLYRHEPQSTNTTDDDSER
jgi:hypothetical protein